MYFLKEGNVFRVYGLVAKVIKGYHDPKLFFDADLLVLKYSKYDFYSLKKYVFLPNHYELKHFCS